MDNVTLQERRDKTSFAFQAVLVSLFICLPSNIVTLWLLYDPQASLRGLFAKESNLTAVKEEVTGEFTCYEKATDYEEILRLCDFWLHGVVMSVTGAFGLVGNLLTLHILPKVETNHNFHKLLMSLATVDCLVIVLFVSDLSVCGQFLSSEPAWYQVAYPYVVHPFRNMTLTASIFMVVAISVERYKAICHPLKYRPSHFKYVVLVLVTTFCLEIPRFFEFKLIETPGGSLTYWPTPLMDNELFVQFTAYWDDILTTGLFPFAALLYFNVCIYRKIHNSRHHEYRFVGRQPSTPRQSLNLCESNNAHGNEERCLQRRCYSERGNKKTKKLSDRRGSSLRENDLPRNEKYKAAVESSRRQTFAQIQTSSSFNTLSSALAGSPEVIRKTQRQDIVMSPNILRLKRLEQSSMKKISNDEFSYLSSPCSEPAKTTTKESPPKRNSFKAFQINPRRETDTKKLFRKRREKSTALLVAIVVIFVLCQVYRLIIQIVELAVYGNVTEEHFLHCHGQGRHHVPVAQRLLLMVNHVFIVVNSSVNFILYCMVGTEFRRKCWRLVTKCFSRSTTEE